MIFTTFTKIFGGMAIALAITFGWEGRELAKDFLERLCKGKEKRKDKISYIW
jgi:hypothetical protein